jgi:hypothetical protein
MHAHVVRCLVCSPLSPFPPASPPGPGPASPPGPGPAYPPVSPLHVVVSYRGSDRRQSEPRHLTSLLLPPPPFCIPSALVVTVPPVFKAHIMLHTMFPTLFLSPHMLFAFVCMHNIARSSGLYHPLPWLQPKGLTAWLNAACIRSHEPSLSALANTPANVLANTNAKDDLRVLVRPRNGRPPANAPTVGATMPRWDRVPKWRVVNNTRCIAPQGWCHRRHVCGLELAPAVAWECHRRGLPRVTGWPPDYWDMTCMSNAHEYYTHFLRIVCPLGPADMELQNPLFAVVMYGSNDSGGLKNPCGYIQHIPW